MIPLLAALLACTAVFFVVLAVWLKMNEKPKRQIFPNGDGMRVTYIDRTETWPPKVQNTPGGSESIDADIPFKLSNTLDPVSELVKGLDDEILLDQNDGR